MWEGGVLCQLVAICIVYAFARHAYRRNQGVGWRSLRKLHAILPLGTDETDS